jgi:hypothetical protein
LVVVAHPSCSRRSYPILTVPTLFFQAILSRAKCTAYAAISVKHAASDHVTEKGILPQQGQA